MDQTLEPIRAAVKQRGLSEVARRLNVHKNTLANVLAGAARQGNVALVVQRFNAQPEGQP